MLGVFARYGFGAFVAKRAGLNIVVSAAAAKKHGDVGKRAAVFLVEGLRGLRVSDRGEAALHPREMDDVPFEALGGVERAELDPVVAGVEAVAIINGRVPHAVLLELFTKHGTGTIINRPRIR